MIRIQEIFTKTVQGEGSWSGIRADFIRLWGCPVRCSWCDTGYSDGGKNIPYLSLSIADAVAKMESDRVVVTGGEPYIHDELPDLVDALTQANRLVHIETSGIRHRSLVNVHWITLSPKEHLTGWEVDDRLWEESSELKIVVESINDFEFYLNKINQYGWCNRPVFVQPCDRPDVSLKDSILPCLDVLNKYQWVKISLQTHKILGLK